MHDTTTAQAPALRRAAARSARIAAPLVPQADADTDAAIIANSLAEPERFADVFDRHYARIHAYVARRLGAGLADDVASETFVTAFDRRSRYDAEYPDAAPWLYGIASNLVSRLRRAEVRRYRALARAAADGIEDHDEGLADRLDAQALRTQLVAALLAIPARDRDVLLLVAWAGLNVEEAARALGLPAGTARSRLHRARRRTRAALAQASPPPLEEDQR
jgi:RNA polymerase sigma-70 factor (ECF subfamily)